MRSLGLSAGGWCAFFLLFAPAVACRSAPPLDAIVIGVPYEVDTLDPHARNSLSHFALVSHVYEPLVTTDAEMRIQPCLARRWETPDLVTWLFDLEPGARFHSGRPLKAADVVFSIERLLRDPSLQIAGYVLYIAEVKALSDARVLVRTTRPLSVLLNKLRFVHVVPEGSTTETLAQRADGTGPYRIESWTPGKRLALRRNDPYWGRKPPLRAVELRLGLSPEQSRDEFLAGRCQLVQCNSKRLAAELARSARAELRRRTSPFVKYVSYDMARELVPGVPAKPNPFRDRRVRLALHLGVDRRQLVASLPLEAVPALQLVPPTVFGFNPRLPEPAHDPMRARALLVEAGLAEGLRATLHARRLFAEAAFALRDQLRPLGVELQVQVLPDPEFLERAGRHELSLYLSRFGCPTGDASDILDNALHTPDASRRLGLMNYSQYSSAEMDRAIEESAGIPEAPRRRQALEWIMEKAMEDLVWVPLYLDQDVYALDRAYAWQPRNDSFILAAEIAPR